MGFKSLIFGSCLLFTFTSCEKASYDDRPVNDPVFQLSYLANGVAEELVAGDNDLYMFTAPGTSSEGVPMATGTLTNRIGSPQGPSWKIAFLSPVKNVFSMDAFLPGPRTLYSIFNTRRSGADFTLRFVPLPTDSIDVQEYIWRIDAQGTTFTSTQNPVVTIDEAITPEITVTLTIRYQNQCRDDIQHVINFSDITARSDFNIQQTSSMSYEFVRNDPREVEQDSIIWLLNNVQVGVGETFAHTFTTTGQYKIKMQTFLGNGQTSETTRDLFVDNQLNSRCHSNFSFELTPAGGLDFFQTNRVLIEYTDTSGTVFSSRNAITQEGVNITDFEYYTPNNSNQPTAQVGLTGDFNLYDKDGNTLEIKDFSGNFGVALP